MDNIAPIFSGLISLAIAIAMIAGMWKTFEKAGEPGWACLIPIYGQVVLLKIVGRPWWFAVLLLIPLVNIVGAIMLLIATFELSKAFGKEAGFGLGLIFLPFAFYPMLGFGDAQYRGPVHQN